MKTAKFVTITILLLFITTFSITGTVMSQNKNGRTIDTKYFKALEKQYVDQVREELKEQGYVNAGIAMTWITDGEEMREYTIVIHHRKIKKLDVEERNELVNSLMRTDFPVEGCRFNYEFLE